MHAGGLLVSTVLELSSPTLLDRMEQEIRCSGFSVARCKETHALLSAEAHAQSPAFTASWDDLGEDTYMADGGRYRRRHHAVFLLRGGTLDRSAHQPHYQSRDYNRLNGGVQRWFDPISDVVAQSAILADLVAASERLMKRLESRGPHARRVEVHQFRIAPNADEEALPTPEGMHRDGVDWVCVLLIKRVNVVRGETTISDGSGDVVGAFTLVDPLDMAFLDDRRVAHGVTPIRRLDPDWPGFRDVLVITFAAHDEQAGVDPSGATSVSERHA